MGGLIAAVVILAIALIVLLIVHLLQRRRIKRLPLWYNNDKPGKP